VFIWYILCSFGTFFPVLVSFFNKNLATLAPSDRGHQGDQIGRIFAQWAIAYFGQVFIIYRSSKKFCATIFQLLCINFDIKWVGLYFERFFHKLIYLVNLFKGESLPALPNWAMFYLFNVQCLYFSLKITQTMYIKSIFTPAVLFFSNKPYTLAGLEPGLLFFRLIWNVFFSLSRRVKLSSTSSVT
jgi:hypothetical protein